MMNTIHWIATENLGGHNAWNSNMGSTMTWAEILSSGGAEFQVLRDQLEFLGGTKVPAWGTFRIDATLLGAYGADIPFGAKDAAKYLTMLGSVGEGYEPYSIMLKDSNSSDSLDDSVDGAHYETAGVLDLGEIVWGLVDLNLAINIGEDKQ